MNTNFPSKFGNMNLDILGINCYLITIMDLQCLLSLIQSLCDNPNSNNPLDEVVFSSKYAC